MSKVKQYNRVLSFGAKPEQIDKLKLISKLTGMKVSNVVRHIIDSAIPDVDPTTQFWMSCKNSGIFKINIPANTIVPFISSWLDLPVSGKNKIEDVEIHLNAPNGLSPMLWALKNIEENFYAQGLLNSTNKQGESKNTKKVY